ncbi:PilZ domain-containing protein [Salinisphaera sp. RV14]|uniref:PilZ domain-containing protein n=1 Tax=unclassified Salinisphaera TaxID=2649847 RepID=UPI003F8413F8
MGQSTEFFSSENAVSGTAARGVLNRLAQLSVRVDVIRANFENVEPSRIIDLMMRGRVMQLELDQPINASHATPRHNIGDELSLYWSDNGMRYGVRAVVAEVREEEAGLSYLLDVDDTVYRKQEERVNDRIPVEAGDGLKATLSAGRRSTRLNPVVKDISASGIRLSLSVREINAAELEPRLNAKLALTLPTANDPLRTHITIAWMQQINDQSCDFGCFWRQPPDIFLEPLERFIALYTQDDDSER